MVKRSDELGSSPIPHDHAFDVVVVGSLNIDVVLHVERSPKPGETVIARRRTDNIGGKGANQAVAARRAGASVAMIGRVGNDAAGQRLLAALSAEGVDTRCITVDEHAPTGTATVMLDSSGQNMIVVDAGANHRVTSDDIARYADVIGPARVLLAQLEIPLDAVTEAGFSTSGTLVLNPAPTASLPPDLMHRVDVLVSCQADP